MNVIIIGAGAAGMMCAINAAKRGRKVLLLEHTKKPGEKIRISGGGRCNFTNINCAPQNFISANPHFVKSALAQYSAADFLALVESHGIAWHEKALGQLFCDDSATLIINMLLQEMAAAGVTLMTDVEVTAITQKTNEFHLTTTKGDFSSPSLVIASGGKSIPKMGATGFGYEIAKQFNVNILPTRPALVPFTFDRDRLDTFSNLVGTAFECRASVNGTSFEEAALFTHRGLSGPAMLQISSFWREGNEISIAFIQAPNLPDELHKAKSSSGKLEVQNWLAKFLPQSLARFLCTQAKVEGRLGDMRNNDIARLSVICQNWRLIPAGSEGYRTAEVTLGGIDTNELHSRTMEVKKTPGLYFIGEVVDVTGWLGGYNFQWAWSSGWAAGQHA